MDWQEQLIEIYLYTYKYYHNGLWTIVQRLSNNLNPKFTDEEVITIFLFGIIQKRFEVKDIYNYTKNHLHDWFPKLPSYGGYIQRLNRINDIFPSLIKQIMSDAPRTDVLENIKLLDSMPIIMANAKRSSYAKVASHVANKGFCSSKGIYFYGVKLHVLGTKRYKRIPFPDYIELTSASEYDLNIFRVIAPYLNDLDIYVDKAYRDKVLKTDLKQEQNVNLYTPCKKKKGQKFLNSSQKLFSTAVSRVRQPIESFFNWIQEKTGIQTASKVRSHKGLMVHVFGRLAAAMYMLAFNS